MQAFCFVAKWRRRGGGAIGFLLSKLWNIHRYRLVHNNNGN